MQTRQWEDKDGNKRYTTEIVATDVQFLGSRDAGTGRGSAGPAAVPEYSGPPLAQDQDDEIPF